MTLTLRIFASEVTRVARELGAEGELGGQAQVPCVAGIWKDLTDSVNLMAGNLTAQVRNIAQVTTAVAQGDLMKKIDVDADRSRGQRVLRRRRGTLITPEGPVSIRTGTQVTFERGSERWPAITWRRTASCG